MPWIAAGCVYVRDQDSGYVTLDANGGPSVNYWPSPRDRESILSVSPLPHSLLGLSFKKASSAFSQLQIWRQVLQIGCRTLAGLAQQSFLDLQLAVRHSRTNKWCYSQLTCRVSKLLCKPWLLLGHVVLFPTTMAWPSKSWSLIGYRMAQFCILRGLKSSFNQWNLLVGLFRKLAEHDFYFCVLRVEGPMHPAYSQPKSRAYLLRCS